MTTRMLYLPALLLAAVLVACAAALLALSEKAEATFPGKNGRIAYVRYGVIYTINPNGSSRTKVTRGGEPSYSPDGKRIAYVASDGNDREIYTIKVGGGGKTQVTHNDTADGSPTYSPDGKKIAYEAWERFGPEIYTKKVDGGSRTQLTHNKGYKWAGSPTYSPSGERIAYECIDGNMLGTADVEICTINVRGGGKFQVTHNDTEDSDPDYSPNGNRIVYAGYGGNVDDNATDDASINIYTIKVGGGGKHNVSKNANNDWVRNHSPSYSPDGKKIAYVSPRGDSEIYTTKVGGGGKTQVPNTAKIGYGLSWGMRP